MPSVIARLPRLLEWERREADRWWRETVFGPAPGLSEARTLLVEARDRFRRYMRAHVMAGFLCQGVYDQVAQTAAALGRPGMETMLVRGYGGLEETRLAADLWSVSRGRLELEEFLRRHGYHGPHEGELSSRAWREHTAPITSLLDRYRGMGEDADPRLIEQQRMRERETSEAQLLAGATGIRALHAKAVLRMARRHVAGREVGKASFLQAMDVGRFACRHIGAQLVGRGVLADADDVFALTLDEVLDAGLVDAQGRVKARRELRAKRIGGRLPDTWTGNPKLLGPAAADDRTSVIGIAASAGVYEGVARVITDPSTEDLDDGEILVCEVTDPSWSALFVVAGAVVTDVGGPISHGAIVAREMGLPAVVNTRVGTRVIRDGDRVRVDGAAGTVEILTRSARISTQPMTDA
jgi:pyruvate,water dikinase